MPEICIWTKFNRVLSRQRLERIETTDIYCSGKKDRWKNGEIVLALFESPSKVKSGRFSQACHYSLAKKMAQRVFFRSFYFVLILYIHLISSWAVCSKGLGLVACVCLHFCHYCKLREQSIYRDVRAFFHFYVTISRGTFNNYFIQRNVIIVIVWLKCLLSNWN